MTKNCWEFKKCGREVDGVKVRELGVCPAASATEADGFCDGKNGGRGCAFIDGTFCGGVIQGSKKHKEKDCFKCDFFKELKKEYGVEYSVFGFGRYVKNNRPQK
ncbi:MAG: hypothetical protein PHX78_11245 [bacterium]|nr:hypothetical protein [bacterium]